MTIGINIPDIGDDVVEIIEILVKVGDVIKKEQPLIIVEGNKTSIEIPSPHTGIVKEINVSVGDSVKTGTRIMVFDFIDDTTIFSVPVQQKIEKESIQGTIAYSERNITVPDIGNDIVEVTDILVKVGDKISIEQPLITVEGNKVSMDIPAPCTGIVKELKISVGDKISNDSLIMICMEENVVCSAPSSFKEDISDFVVVEGNKEPDMTSIIKEEEDAKFLKKDSFVHATPLIRRLAHEFGIDLSKVKGTGRKNRILREDLYDYIKKTIKFTETAIANTISDSVSFDIPLWPNLDFAKFGKVEETEISHIQKISGANMSRNWIMIPHVTHFDDADITSLEEFRNQQNAEAKKNKLNVKITLVVFIMKAVAAALKKMPHFNSSLSKDKKHLILKKYINIGVAVDTKNGLVVPVFKNVHEKCIIELSSEFSTIIQKARDGKLIAKEMQGGCFTISSIGGLGTTHFVPIVNAPEVAILGISRSSIKPIWNGKEFSPRLILPLSLSFDHRVIDGADGARFITIISNILSDVRLLVM